MALYLDTEFNGNSGQLMSLALVSPKGSEWYEVLPLPNSLNPWVAENVVPFLDKTPITIEEFKTKLSGFLRFHAWNVRLQRQTPVHIYADWPEDFIHLLRLMYEVDTEGAKQWNIEVILHRVESGPMQSEKPHNALSDARALMKWDQSQVDDAVIGVPSDPVP